MFPPQIAHVFVRWLTEPGDLVYDPFSGRGTVALEAGLLGRRAAGADLNPLAVVLSGAKVDVPSEVRAQRRLKQLAAAYDSDSEELSAIPAEIRMLYSDLTLCQLVYLRRTLKRGHPVDRLLLAAVLGMLHANHQGGQATRGFSISMPNTFAMSPTYVAGYIEEHGLVAPDLDVFDMVSKRLGRLGLPSTTRSCGTIAQRDATVEVPDELRGKARLILTSPPYLKVIEYGKYNWVRLWFLGENWRDVDSALMTTSSLPKYLQFMRRSLDRMREVVAEDGFVGLVIGDVRRGESQLELGHLVRDEVAIPGGWHCHGVIRDRLPTGHKVSRIWKTDTGGATKTDRILLLSPSETELPMLGPILWGPPSFSDAESQ